MTILLLYKNDAGRDITGCGAPFLFAGFVKGIDGSWQQVILSVGHIHIPGYGIYCNAVR